LLAIAPAAKKQRPSMIHNSMKKGEIQEERVEALRLECSVVDRRKILEGKLQVLL
jgi:hypothetical protein